MKKQVSIAFIIVFLLIVGIVYAQSMNPGSSDSTGKEKDSFSSAEDVYVKSTSVCTRNKAIKLFIVNDKTIWNSGDKLNDVRNASQEITTDEDANLPLTKIWSNPLSGKYDIILDCNNNGEYDADPIMEPIDSLGLTGFAVVAAPGRGKVSLGANNPLAHPWQYDPEMPILLNEMLQLTLEAIGEDIKIENITLKASGTGNDLEIENIEFYVDGNNNGKIDTGESKLGESKYDKDDGISTTNFTYDITKNISINILVVYIMKENATGNFNLTVEAISGKGKESDKIIGFEGPPLSSEAKTTLPKKSCFGIMTLKLEPNPVKEKSKVKAIVSNLTGCENKLIKLQKKSCSDLVTETTCSCIVKDRGCECEFTSGSSSQFYWACIDKNNDTDRVDYGESASENLVILAKEIVSNVTNITETPALVNLTITGEAEEEKIKLLTPTSILFIILEATLILILIVLFLILASLRKRK